jgi:hypothetical protein
MAKGDQRNEKMVKKPKKNSTPSTGGSPSDRPTAPVTLVMPRGADKKK